MKYSSNLSQGEELEFEKIDIVKSLFSIFFSWAVIAFAFYLTANISHWLFPISFILITNRQLALSLISHEGIHRSLLPHPFWNDFVARYLCAFPVYISLSRYRTMHLMHHRFLGTPIDPDRGLYADYPAPFGQYLIRSAKNFLSGKTIWDFMDYYTDIPTLVRTKFLLGRKKTPLSSDFIQYACFIFISAAIIYQYELSSFYFSLWLLPSILYLPYVLAIGGLQHGPIKNNEELALKSRTILGSKALMELLLPVDINFHAEHHLNPRIPHYKLKEYSLALRKNESRTLWRESYADALKNLFT